MEMTSLTHKMALIAFQIHAVAKYAIFKYVAKVSGNSIWKFLLFDLNSEKVRIIW